MRDPRLVTPAFRAVMTICTPITRWWGRLEVSGLEHLPESGPVLLAGNHDSFWDPIAIGTAGVRRRQIQALAKHTLWKNPVVAWILNGMGQIPIDRGKGDVGALERAIGELRDGACIGMFPEGTRSRGRVLRARSGMGRIAEAVPEAQIVCASVQGTVDIVRFPKRPHIKVRFFAPAEGAKRPDESPSDFSARVLAELRASAPIAPSGRKGEAAPEKQAEPTASR